MEGLGLAQERTRPSRTTGAKPSAFCCRSTRALAARAKPVPTRPQRPGAAVLRRANEKHKRCPRPTACRGFFFASNKRFKAVAGRPRKNVAKYPDREERGSKGT